MVDVNSWANAYHARPQVKKERVVILGSGESFFFFFFFSSSSTRALVKDSIN